MKTRPIHQPAPDAARWTTVCRTNVRGMNGRWTNGFTAIPLAFATAALLASTSMPTLALAQIASQPIAMTNAAVASAAPARNNGMRYLSWSGKPAAPNTTMAAPANADSAANSAPGPDGLRRTSLSGDAPTPVAASAAPRPSRYSSAMGYPSIASGSVPAATPTAPRTSRYSAPEPQARGPEALPSVRQDHVAANAPAYAPTAFTTPAPTPLPAARPGYTPVPRSPVPTANAAYEAQPDARPDARPQTPPPPPPQQNASLTPVRPSAALAAPAQSYAPPQQQQRAAPQPIAPQPAPQPQVHADPPAAAVAAAVAAASPTPFDPMAPRRDAPIFRMRQNPAAPMQSEAQTPEPTAPSVSAQVQDPNPAQAAADAAPAPAAYAANPMPQGRDGARYYSVHRAAGHRPDPTPMPVSVYLENVPMDLAAPPEAPPVQRLINGRVQTIAANEDPSLP